MTSAQGGIVLTIVAHEDVHLAIVRQKGDWGDAYLKKAALLRLSKADMEKLALKDGARIELTSAAGSVVVAAKSDATGEAGVGYMAASLYTNRLASYDSGSSVSPGTHIEARAVVTDKAVTPISDLKVKRTRA